MLARQSPGRPAAGGRVRELGCGGAAEGWAAGI